MESLLSRYKEELGVARVEFSDRQCIAFGRRWLSEAANRLEVRLRYCSGPATAHTRRLLSRYDLCKHPRVGVESEITFKERSKGLKEQLSLLGRQATTLQLHRDSILSGMEMVAQTLAEARSRAGPGDGDEVTNTENRGFRRSS